MHTVRRLLSILSVALWCVAAPAFATDCTAIPGNAVVPCGFESSADVSAWTPNGGTASFAAGLGEDGGAARGTAQDYSGLWVFGMRSPCFAVAPGQQVALGYSVSLASGAAPGCNAGWQQWSDAACTVGNSGANGFNSVVPGGGYSAVTDSHIVTSGTVAMSLTIDCRTDGAFEVLVDNTFAILPLPPAAQVPALGGAGLAALALLLVVGAVLRLRHRAGG